MAKRLPVALYINYSEDREKSRAVEVLSFSVCHILEARKRTNYFVFRDIGGRFRTFTLTEKLLEFQKVNQNLNFQLLVSILRHISYMQRIKTSCYYSISPHENVISGSQNTFLGVFKAEVLRNIWIRMKPYQETEVARNDWNMSLSKTYGPSETFEKFTENVFGLHWSITLRNIT